MYVQLIVSNGATPLVDAIAYTLADEGGMYLHVIYSMPSYIGVTFVIMHGHQGSVVVAKSSIFFSKGLPRYTCVLIYCKSWPSLMSKFIISVFAFLKGAKIKQEQNFIQHNYLSYQCTVVTKSYFY